MAAGRVVGAASYLLELETGQFNANAAEAERVWAGTTARMSESTLKVDIAARRLRETLAKYPNDVARVERATLAYRNAQREATAATVSASRSVERHSSVSRGLAGAFSFATTALIGGAGLVYGLKAAIGAAEEHQVAERQLGAAVRAAGLSYATYGQQISQALRAQRLLTGFTEQDTLRSFTALIRSTKNVSDALKLQALAANVARGRGIDLAAATMIVIKAHMGMGGQLRRLGIDVDKHATALQLLTKLTQVYGGSVVAWSHTAAGAQARFTQAVYETKVAVGEALLPVVTKYLNEGTRWLSQSQNQARIQRDVKEAVAGVTTAVHVLSEGFKIAGETLVPVTRALGGFENLLKLVGLEIVALRLARLANGFRSVAASEALASAGARGLRGSLLSLPTRIGITIAVGYEVARGGRALDRYLGTLGHGLGQENVTAKQLAPIAAAGGISLQQLKEMHDIGAISDADYAKIKAIVERQQGTSGGAIATGRSGALPPRATSPSRPPPLSATLPASLTLAEARASAVYGPDSAQEQAALQAEKAYLLKALSDKRQSVAARTQLYNELEAVNAQLASITRKGVSAEKKLTEARKRAAREAAQDRREREKAYRESLTHTQAELQLEVENAKALEEKAGKDQRLKALEEYYLDQAYKNLIAFDKKQSENRRLKQQERDRYAKEAAAAELADSRLNAKRRPSRGSFDAERFFLEQQSTFFGSFGSNVFTESTTGGRTHRTPGSRQPPVVIVNQHFNRPTIDRHREMRLAHLAARAQFDS